MYWAGEVVSYDGRDWTYNPCDDTWISKKDGKVKVANSAEEKGIQKAMLWISQEKELSALKQAVELFSDLSPVSRQNLLAYLNKKFTA